MMAAAGDHVARTLAALRAAGVSVDATRLALAAATGLDRCWWDSRIPALITLAGEAAPDLAKALAGAYPSDAALWRIADARCTPHTVADAGALRGPAALYLPPIPEAHRRADYADFIRVIARLRAPDGCPWDRQQTHASLKRYLLEETYEALEAIDAGDAERLCDELGDVLLQIALHAQIAAEAGDFTERDVVDRITEKMIRRHPHVFGDVDVADADEVLRNWEAIKRGESPERQSLLDGVPASLPALLRASDLSRRAAKVGFDWPSLAEVWAKACEELAELEAELPAGDASRRAEELGDVLFTLVNVARWTEVDPEDALRQAAARFERRFREVERLAAAERHDLRALDLAALDALWVRAKSRVG